MEADALAHEMSPLLGRFLQQLANPIPQNPVAFAP